MYLPNVANFRNIGHLDVYIYIIYCVNALTNHENFKMQMYKVAQFSWLDYFTLLLQVCVQISNGAAIFSGEDSL